MFSRALLIGRGLFLKSVEINEAAQRRWLCEGKDKQVAKRRLRMTAVVSEANGQIFDLTGGIRPKKVKMITSYFSLCNFQRTSFAGDQA